MEWIKCSDRIPAPNTKVLIFCNKDDGYEEGIMIADWYEGSKGAVWWCSCHNTSPVQPTHWMNLPQYPKDKALDKRRIK